MLRDVFGNTRASISVLRALTILTVIGFSGLALDCGHGLLRRVENQRIADIADAGAPFQIWTGSTSTSSFAVGNLASLNGLTSSAASSSVLSFPDRGRQSAVLVTIITNVKIQPAARTASVPTKKTSTSGREHRET
jgi:uncharacterized membrane protein